MKEIINNNVEICPCNECWKIDKTISGLSSIILKYIYIYKISNSLQLA